MISKIIQKFAKQHKGSFTFKGEILNGESLLKQPSISPNLYQEAWSIVAWLAGRKRNSET